MKCVTMAFQIVKNCLCLQTVCRARAHNILSSIYRMRHWAQSFYCDEDEIQQKHLRKNV